MFLENKRALNLTSI